VKGQILKYRQQQSTFRQKSSVDFVPRVSYIEGSVQGATVSAEMAEPTWSYVVFTVGVLPLGSRRGHRAEQQIAAERRSS
jgi:hypothetical protein